MRQVGLVGAASGELVVGVAQLRPEEAMLRGWRAQQSARGCRLARLDIVSGWCVRSWRSTTSSPGRGVRPTSMNGR